MSVMFGLLLLALTMSVAASIVALLWNTFR